VTGGAATLVARPGTAAAGQAHMLRPVRSPIIDTARDETALIDRLRAGDERAFAELVDAHARSMKRVARAHVSSDAVAEEVVQETWLGVLNGLGRFEGRSSLKHWIFTILTNRAKTRGVAEHRTVPFAALAALEAEDRSHAVDPDRFLPADHERAPHHWATPPRRWELSPEASVSHGEVLGVVRAAIATLPPVQRMVIVMRDLEGFASEEVCDLLELSQGNQRILLHRARSRVRGALEEHLAA
jgi:RNA polymerase sigma-70 factor (ECF subfamily)